MILHGRFQFPFEHSFSGKLIRKLRVRLIKKWRKRIQSYILWPRIMSGGIGKKTIFFLREQYFSCLRSPPKGPNLFLKTCQTAMLPFGTRCGAPFYLSICQILMWSLSHAWFSQVENSVHSSRNKPTIVGCVHFHCGRADRPNGGYKCLWN